MGIAAALFGAAKLLAPQQEQPSLAGHGDGSRQPVGPQHPGGAGVVLLQGVQGHHQLIPQG